MGSINESAKKIVDIIGVIDGIAFQTNILWPSECRAVEAARSRVSKGRGFAVVATEVRNLAQRSAAAAKEIKSLIGDSVEKVGARQQTASTTRQAATMNEVVESIRRVTDIMAEITAASQEQTSGIEQVNQAIGAMDEGTQQNAALVEQAAAAAGAMQDQAAGLAQVVSVFKLDAGQTASSSRAIAQAKPKSGARAPAIAQRKGPAARVTHNPAPRSPAKIAAKAGKNAEEWEEF